MMKKYLRCCFYGFLTWLIPFVASIFFYTKEGILTIDVSFFKSIMIVVGTFSASGLLISYFKKIDSEYAKEGFIVGFVWLCINILLDLLVLVQMSGMSIPNYFMKIGLGYLAIPAMSVTVGVALRNRK